MALRSAAARCPWASTGQLSLLRLAPAVGRRARLLTSCSAPAAAAATDAASTQQLPAVPPPPEVAFSAEAANSVSLSGTVLTDPQVHYFAANQVAAHVRVGLPPRLSHHSLPQAPSGAVTVDAWGVVALQLAQHVRKGQRIHVRGHLREDSWADKATGERRYMVKVLAEELALLAPGEARHPQHQPPPEAAAAAVQPEQQQRQQQQGQPWPEEPPPQQPGSAAQAQKAPPHGHGRQPPRVTASAEVSHHMYEQQGLGLQEIAAFRGIKPSTVLSHLLACAREGGATSWQRLAADVRLGPPGSAWLSPAEVAEAVFQAQADMPDAELGRLPLNSIRRHLEESPGAAPKVAALLAATNGDPYLLYGACDVVLAMLERGVSFSVVAEPAQGGDGAPF